MRCSTIHGFLFVPKAIETVTEPKEVANRVRNEMPPSVTMLNEKNILKKYERRKNMWELRQDLYGKELNLCPQC